MNGMTKILDLFVKVTEQSQAKTVNHTAKWTVAQALECA